VEQYIYSMTKDQKELLKSEKVTFTDSTGLCAPLPGELIYAQIGTWHKLLNVFTIQRENLFKDALNYITIYFVLAQRNTI